MGAWGSDKPAILFVDDEEIIRKTFVRELQMEGFAVTAADGGRQALAILAEGEFDLVITDLVMPEIDGLGVLKAAKETAPHIGVIILTGYGDIGSAIAALRLGADDFTLKPCEIEELTLRIHRCLEKGQLLQ
ncbi:MAG TPA: response regulator, partial [Desulforhopalus sp.]|nr:response regulator [Desulforhopalus sp.]